MHRGFVLLWRKVEDSGWIRNHKLWAFWSWCLIKASYKPRKIVVGRQEIDLEPGQFIMGRKSASEATGLTEQEVRSATATLVGSRNLTIKSTNKFSIVSIINWDVYQNLNTKINQQINQPLTNKQPTNNHKQYSNKEKNNTYSPDFLSFYLAYPRKVAKSKAWEAWEKCNGNRPEISLLLVSVEKQKNSDQWKKNNGQYIPHPATWINQRRWEDEIDNGTSNSGPFSSSYS